MRNISVDPAFFLNASIENAYISPGTWYFSYLSNAVVEAKKQINKLFFLECEM